MPKFKATKKFKTLGTENSYHYMETEQFYALQRGETVEMSLNVRNQYLIDEKYLSKLDDTVSSRQYLDGITQLNNLKKLSTNKNVKGA